MLKGCATLCGSGEGEHGKKGKVQIKVSGKKKCEARRKARKGE
jgi:hypothetical protein